MEPTIDATLLALFKTEFRDSMVLFQGFMSFTLLAFWIGSLWTDLVKKISSSRTDQLWALIALSIGVVYIFAAGYDWGSEFTLAAVSIGLSITLSLLHPTAAVCFFLSLLFLRPWEMIENNDYFGILPKLGFNLCVANIAIILYQQLRKNGVLKLTWDAATTYLILFAFWAFVTTVKAPDPAIAQAKYFDTFFKALFLYLMIINVLTQKKDLRILIGTLVLTFFGVGVVSMIQTVQLSATLGEKQRLMGFGAFANSNDIAALMVLVAPFALMTAVRTTETLVLRATASFVLLIVLGSIYMSQSRGAMLAFGIALGFFLVKKVQKRWLNIAFAVGALLILVVYFKFSGRSEDDLSQSSSSRMTYIKTGINMGIRNPILGVGYESYEVKFEEYATEILYEWGHRTAHNSWILVFAETGFPGLILFLMIFFHSYKNAGAVFNEFPEYQISLIGYSITITFLSHSYVLYPYLLYAMIAAALNVNKERPEHTLTPEVAL